MSTFNEFLDGNLNQSFDEYLGGEAQAAAINPEKKEVCFDEAKAAYEKALTSAKAAYEKTLSSAKTAYEKATTGTKEVLGKAGTVAKDVYTHAADGADKVYKKTRDEINKTVVEVKENKSLVIKVAVVSAVTTVAVIGLCKWFTKD